LDVDRDFCEVAIVEAGEVRSAGRIETTLPVRSWGSGCPDEQTRVLRRLARRTQLVRARTRARNECHAVLVRRLITKLAVSDLFGLGSPLASGGRVAG
jgi:hypothetical protein